MRFARSPVIWPWLAGLAAWWLYLLTLFPGVGGSLNHGDSAKFQYLGVVPGVGHAPGNPLYLLLLHVAQVVPWGTPAYRAELLSATCAAWAVGWVYAAGQRLAGPLAALVSAVTLALGGVYWKFATEAEVYAFSAVIVAGVVWSLVRATQQRSAFFLSLALCLGALGVANHLTLVLMAPMLLYATWHLWREGIRLGAKHGVALVGVIALTLGLYAMLPVVDSVAVYSEYPRQHSLKTFVYFVSGSRWHAQLGLGSLREALFARSAALVAVLLRQWTLPLWLLAPLALQRLVACDVLLARFCAGSALLWASFLYLYKIPDPDGLVVPLATCLAPAVGVAVASWRRVTLALAGVALLLVPTVLFRFQEQRGFTGFELWEDVRGRPVQRELLDWPQLVETLPQGAWFTLPCFHYGCLQVANYYRFADPGALRRQLHVVALRGSYAVPGASPPETIDPELSLQQTVCTIHPSERRLLLGRGARLQRLQRGRISTPTGSSERVAVWCSVPQG